MIKIKHNHTNQLNDQISFPEQRIAGQVVNLAGKGIIIGQHPLNDDDPTLVDEVHTKGGNVQVFDRDCKKI